MATGAINRSFASQRLTLNYVDWGNAGAPLLILQHGGRDHARSWDWIAQALARDFHVICPDLRGHGDSAWSPDGAYGLPLFVADLAELIHQCGAERVSIVAHSLGGAIALRYAGLYPERIARIAAIEGIGLPRADRDQPAAERLRDFIERRRVVLARAPRRYGSLEEAIARMRAANKHLSEEQVRHLTHHAVRLQEDGSLGWKYDPLLKPFYPVEISKAELRMLWGAITAPTWLVHGANSWAEHPDSAGRSAAFPNACVTSYADAGHWVQHDRLDDFLADLRSFLGGGTPLRMR